MSCHKDSFSFLPASKRYAKVIKRNPHSVAVGKDRCPSAPAALALSAAEKSSSRGLRYFSVASFARCTSILSEATDPFGIAPRRIIDYRIRCK